MSERSVIVYGPVGEQRPAIMISTTVDEWTALVGRDGSHLTYLDLDENGERIPLSQVSSVQED